MIGKIKTGSVLPMLVAATMFVFDLGMPDSAFGEEVKQQVQEAGEPDFGGDVDDSGDLKKTGHSGRAHIHDGFLVRVATGAGFSTDTLNAYGMTYEVNARVGYTIRRNLGVSAEFDFSLSPAGHTGLHPNYFLGISLDYYFMPANVFISASLGYDQLWAGIYNESKKGIAGVLTLGKEWWVSEEWGVGLMLRNAFIGAIEGADQFCYQGALMVSATYF